MKQYDEEVKKKCAELIDENNLYNIKYVGIAALIVNQKIVDKNINVLIREVDTRKSELEVIKEKVKEKYEQVDIDARNCFYKGVGAGTLK